MQVIAQVRIKWTNRANSYITFNIDEGDKNRLKLSLRFLLQRPPIQVDLGTGLSLGNL